MRRLSWSGSLALAFFGWAAYAEEAAPDASPNVAGVAASVEPSVSELPRFEEATLSSGLRVWRGANASSTIEVCSSHRVALRTEQERAALSLLLRIVERGGYRASGEDYSTLLTTRGLVSKASLRGDVVLFCTKGPAKELPLALWTVRGRFARQALTERELEAERVRLRQNGAELGSPEALAMARLRRVILPHYEAELELRASEEARSKVNIEDVRRVHDQVLFAAGSVVTVVGGFSDAVLTRLVTEYLSLPKALNAPVEIPTSSQTSYRYGLVEDVRIQKPSAYFGFAAPEEHRHELELGLAILHERLSEKRRGSHFRLESSAGPVLALATSGADVKELEERKVSLDAVAQTPVTVDVATLKRAERALLQARQDEFVERGGAAVAYWAASGEKVSWLAADGGEQSREKLIAVETALRDGLRSSRRTTIELLPRGFQDPFIEVPPLTHTLEDGETAGTLAYRFGVSQESVLAMAGVNPTWAKGTKLTLPKEAKRRSVGAPARYRVKKGDTLTQVANAHQVSVDELRTINRLSSAELRVDQVLYIAHATLRKDEPLGFPASADSPVKAASDSERVGSLPMASELPLSEAKKREPSGDLTSKEGVASPSNEFSSEGPNDSKSEATETPDASAVERSSKGASEEKPTKGGTAPQKVSPEKKSGSVKAAGVPHVTVSEGKSSKLVPSLPRRSAAVHVVRPGDQLLKLAQHYSVGVSELCELNRLKRDAKLYVGQRIKIPAGRPSQVDGSSAQK